MVMEGVKKLSGSLGAEILGMNLENDLSESMLTDIKGYLNEHEVIFFRDQDISWDTHKKIADFFGPAQTHPAYESPDGYPEITILESTPEKPTLIEEWHTDMTFKKNPPLCSILRSRICPPKGGDTMWAHIVSPPLGGQIRDLKMEQSGGFFLKVMSVCHSSIRVGFSGVLSRIVISG